MKEWWVYVLQSAVPRIDKKGRKRPGFYYVGCTNNLQRRIRQHNGELVGGAKFTSKHRPWHVKAVYGPYADRSEACKAELALKRGKRGKRRTEWSQSDSKWCRGLGKKDPRVI